MNAPPPARVSSSLMPSRPRHGKILAGVCAGIARKTGRSASMIRVLFVISMLLPGPQILLYLALWVLMPPDPPGA